MFIPYEPLTTLIPLSGIRVGSESLAFEFL